MYDTAYEIVAVALRYWFALLVVFILFKIAQNVRAELAAERTIRTKAKGYSLGVLTVLEPEGKLAGRQYILKRENTIGRAGRCDITVRHGSLAAVNASIYQKGREVFLSNYGARGSVLLNGAAVASKDAKLYDGDEIRVGGVLFAIAIGAAGERPEGTPYPRVDDGDDDEEYAGDYADEDGGEDDSCDGNEDGESDGEDDGVAGRKSRRFVIPRDDWEGSDFGKSGGEED